MREGLTNLSRRELLKLLGMSVGASLAADLPWPRQLRAQSSKVTPRKTARNCIFIQNCGAMSPQETLDFKETKYTAKDLDIQKVGADFNLSKTLFPNQGVWAPKASLVRSLRGINLVHFPAQYHTQAGRAMNTAIVREIPAFGSVIAYELDKERRETDTFPTYMSFDLTFARCPPIGSGMLPPRFAGLDLSTNTIFETFSGNGDADTLSTVSERWETLNRILEVSSVRNDRIGEKADEYKASYDYAIKLLQDPRFKKMLTISEQDKLRYGADKDQGRAKFSLAMLLARNALAVDAGARFLWVCNGYNGGNGHFDNHDHLYDRTLPLTGGRISIYHSAPRFDKALAALVQDLSSMPGHEPGKTLFDETLIVVAHEFGRTADMNPHNGRDHWIEAYSDMFLGGGVKPGRVIGKTDEVGAKVIDKGWMHKEQPMMDHVTSTVYSALGIDYSKRIGHTPSGREYEYQQTAPLGGPGFIPLTPIDDLFV
jgi:Protein of unknown function (DUF1501)